MKSGPRADGVRIPSSFGWDAEENRGETAYGMDKYSVSWIRALIAENSVLRCGVAYISSGPL